MPPLSLHCHGHQRPQGTRNQQTAGQMSRSRPAALALPSHVTKSHSVSREIRSVRPLCTSQVYPVSHFHLPPGEHVRLDGSCADQFRPRRVASLSSTTELSAPRSACSGCARLRCCLPLPHHRLQMPQSFHQFIQLFLPVLQRRQTVCLQAKSQLSQMPPRTVPRARQTFSVVEMRCGNILLHNCLHCPLEVLLVVGAHTLEGFPSVPTKDQDGLARRLALGLRLLVVSSRVPEGC